MYGIVPTIMQPSRAMAMVAMLSVVHRSSAITLFGTALQQVRPAFDSFVSLSKQVVARITVVDDWLFVGE